MPSLRPHDYPHRLQTCVDDWTADQLRQRCHYRCQSISSYLRWLILQDLQRTRLTDG